MNKNYSLLIRRSFYAGNLLVFLLFYAVFYYHYSQINYGNNAIFYIVNLLIFALFIVSACNAKAGFYFFIFLVPLLNTVTTIMGIRSVNFPLIMLFAFFLGFLLDYFGRLFREKLLFIDLETGVDTEIGRAFLVFTVIVSISAAIAVFRYANFFPFVTNNYHNLKININGTDSTSAIYWVISFFFSYSIPFLIIFALFNIFTKVRDILVGIIVMVASSTISFMMAFYQYFFNPYTGSFRFWVETGRLNATFSDPNALGAFTILMFPVFLGLIIYFKQWYLKLVFAVLTVPLIFMVVVSGSRSSLVSIFIAALCYLIIGIVLGIKKIRTLSRKKQIYSLVISLAMIAGFIGFMLVVFMTDNVLRDRILNTGLIKRSYETLETFISYNRASGFIESIKSISNYRYIFWEQAINMTRGYPVTGVGTGAYILELPDYIYNFERGFPLTDFTGNYYLQILSELGITGLLLNISIFYFIVKKSVLYYKVSVNNRGFSREKWLFTGLFLSFTAFIISLIFGPHTNFFEIQVMFWTLIGLIFAMIKISDRSGLNYKPVLNIQRRLGFSIAQKIGLSVIIVFFSISFLTSSLGSLSVAAKQDNNNWKNEYGLYQVETFSDKKFRWISIDASTVIEKEGTEIIIPLQDINPAVYEEPLKVKAFIDNYFAGSIKLVDDSWYNLNLKIPVFTGNRITLTLVSSRSWIPKELGLNNDTRELAVRMGEISFK